ncbi:cell division ATP-binding protein FtsE [Nesterenkonia cremea]|uniref:Cell division ATP-binding protein FtsE n=1 Tax=Nesterenkonia cremea TaxID=1882340 RepID=A0A917EP36_9MICC|nr:cell division ATP-binding protein FtsE [Nesterenkonia cremea]GGE61385.1 hypothetical protein GCM10011401_05360 [Nesterenkonia cremea]
MIRFDHVTRRYQQDGRPALDDVSIEFERGDFVFLIGASGSGKSTLLRMILREGLPQKGKITVAGQNLGLMLEKRVPDFRRSIGMVFQDFRLLPDKTVFENVAFAMRVIGAPRSTIRKRVTKVLERVNLDHLAKRYPHEISGGEQQRAAIARAIVNEPAILLADEPTGNLDPRAAEEVMKILRWISSSGTTVIMATHDRPIVDSMRRRVVQLHRGALVRDQQRGTYDPPVGSEAWELLRVEEADSGLRASDPTPAHQKDDDAEASASEPEESAAVDKPEKTGPSQAAAADKAPAEEPEPEPELELEPESEPEPEPAQEESIRVVWPSRDSRESTAEVPEPKRDFDGTELPDLSRDGYEEDEPTDQVNPAEGPVEEPAPAPAPSEHDPELVGDDPQPSAEPAPAVPFRTRPQEAKKHRLDWLAHPERDEISEQDEASEEDEGSSAEENTRRLARPASSPADVSKAQAPRPMAPSDGKSETPRPKSSASQSTYTDARRTAEQLGIPRSRRGFWRRRRDG